MGVGVVKDSDHILLLRCDETSPGAGLVDEVSGVALTQTANPGCATGFIDGARTFNGTTQKALGAVDAVTAADLLGEWTIEMQGVLRNLSLNYNPLIAFSEFTGSTSRNEPGVAYGPTGLAVGANTVALYRFDEAANTDSGIDATGNHTLNDYGNPDVVAGIIDGARSLNGSTKFFQRDWTASLNSTFNGDWTVRGWVKPTALTAGEIVFYGGLNFSTLGADCVLGEVGMLGTGAIFWRQWQNHTTNTLISSTGVMQVGVRKHFQVSRTRTGVNTYRYEICINGVSDTITTGVTGSRPGDVISVTGVGHKLGVGCYVGTGGLGTAGSVINAVFDDLNLENTAHTAAEALTVYQNGIVAPAGSESYLAAVYVQNSGRVSTYWEPNSGTAPYELMTQTTGPALTVDTDVRISLVKRLNTDEVHYDLDLYINGVLAQTFASLVNAENGSSGYWAIADNDGIRSAVEFSEIVVSKVARSSAEIYSNYLAAVGTVPALTQMLKQLLPRGPVWALGADSWIEKTLKGIAGELERVLARGKNLISEADPRTANETIAEWEEALSLPDEQVTAIPDTLAERRIAVTQKYVSRGGQSPQFFVDLAAACGYTVEVSNFNALLFRSGRGRSGDRLYGTGYAYSFLMTVDPPTGPVLAQADFERVIQHAVHSHAHVVFEYL